VVLQGKQGIAPLDIDGLRVAVCRVDVDRLYVPLHAAQRTHHGHRGALLFGRRGHMRRVRWQVPCTAVDAFYGQELAALQIVSQ
jgi:hypothetical protein